MNLNVDAGIKAFLATELSAEETTHGTKDGRITILAATVAGKQVQLLGASTNDPVAEPLPKIVVRASEAKIDASDDSTQLWLCKLELMIATPRGRETFSEADHKAITDVVRGKLVLSKLAEISTALQSHGIAECHRWYFEGAPDAHTDGHWITLLTYDPFGFSVSL